MKKYLLLFVLVLVSMPVNAGKQKVYQHDKVLCNEDRSLCTDKNKKPITGMVETIRSGRRTISMEYKKGKVEGKRIMYSSDGIHPILEMTWVNGKLDGITRTYWNDTHTIKGEKVWYNGNPIGKSVRYYKNGKKQFIVNNDSSEFKFFDRNGQLFATFDQNGITCHNNKEARNATDEQKLSKLISFFDEQDKAAMDPNVLFDTEEHDFTFLCE